MKFIKACASRYGGRSYRFYYANPNQIIEVHVVQTDKEVNAEATLSNGLTIIILNYEDLKTILGDENYNSLEQEINWYKLELERNKHGD